MLNHFALLGGDKSKNKANSQSRVLNHQEDMPSGTLLKELVTERAEAPCENWKRAQEGNVNKIKVYTSNFMTGVST